MKYISALFLCLLIAPFALAQSEILELIQKSPEGKEVLDGIFLNVALEGPNINIKSVSKRLHQIEDHAKNFLKESALERKSHKKSCREQISKLRSRAHFFTTSHLFVERYYSSGKRLKRIRERKIGAARRAFDDFTKLKNAIHKNGKDWQSFWKKGIKDFRKIISLISQIRAHVRKLHRAHKKQALIELPNNYVSALAEITSEFENTYNNLDGLRPVIANLLEVVKNKEHLGKKPVRVSLRKLLSKISKKLREKVYQFQEESEHQVAIFKSIELLFDDWISETHKIVSTLKVVFKDAGKKDNVVKANLKFTAGLAEDSKNIVHLKVKECKAYHHQSQKLRHQAKRVVKHVDQLREVVNDRWPSLRSFFIEKMEKIMNANELKNELDSDDVNV